VSVDERRYVVTAGSHTVLETCSVRTFPVPDAASGFCLYLPISPDALHAGAQLGFSPETTPAYLWELHAPGRFVTSDVDVSLRVVSASADGVRAAVSARKRKHSGEWDWHFKGERLFPYVRILPLGDQHTF